MSAAQFAELREAGFLTGILVLSGGAWHAACATCETDTIASGADTGRWLAWAHNASSAHRLAVTL